MKNFKYLIVLILSLCIHGCGEDPTSQPEQKAPNYTQKIPDYEQKTSEVKQKIIDYEGIIVALGDSLTEGLGVTEESAYPALLEKELSAQGYPYQVINAGISGETSSGILSRITKVLTLKPDIVILVTGGNDGFRGLKPDLIKENISNIIKKLKENRVIIILGGMKTVRNLGENYTTSFEKIYPEVARGEDVGLIPFFLSGVAADPSLNQPDGIHPTADGYRVIVKNMTPFVIEAIKAHKAKMN